MPRIFFILLRFRCKTFKTFMNFVWIEVFVSRGEILLYTLLLIFGSLSELKKNSFAIKRLYEIDSKFASGVILEYLNILAKHYPVLSFLFATMDLYPEVNYLTFLP